MTFYASMIDIVTSIKLLSNTMLSCFNKEHHHLHRYVYNYLGGKHENVLDELIASLSTYGIMSLWLGPSWVVFIWAFLNCFGLNFELWTAKLFSMEPFISIEVRNMSSNNFLDFVVRYSDMDSANDNSSAPVLSSGQIIGAKKVL